MKGHILAFDEKEGLNGVVGGSSSVRSIKYAENMSGWWQVLKLTTFRDTLDYPLLNASVVFPCALTSLTSLAHTGFSGSLAYW